MWFKGDRISNRKHGWLARNWTVHDCIKVFKLNNFLKCADQ